MTGTPSKKHIVISRHGGNKAWNLKKVFSALCAFACGTLTVLYAPRTLHYVSEYTTPESPVYRSADFKDNPPRNERTVATNKHATGYFHQQRIATRKWGRPEPLSAHMKEQVRFLRDAIEEAHHHDLNLAENPKCVGDLAKGEVEDILCIPRPEFIKEVKNPCWWDTTNATILRCIPYFHILGCEKCGTSDLWNRITSHPHIARITGMVQKEANWWGWGRYGRFHYSKVNVRSFNSYTNSFKHLSQTVRDSLQNGDNVHEYLVTGDGTPSDLQDFRGWVNISQNRGLQLPQVITPQLMKHMYPETTKFIVILRNPIERLYSDYCFATGGRSPRSFHNNLQRVIDNMVNCIRGRSVRECFFDLKMYRVDMMRLHLILYTLHLKEWLKVFPRERFLFLKTEEYEKDIYGTIKKCYEFLGLAPLEDNQLLAIAKHQRSRVGSNKKMSGPMWRSSKEILEEIIKPSLHFLPELLQDDRFTWDLNSTRVIQH